MHISEKFLIIIGCMKMCLKCCFLSDIACEDKKELEYQLQSTEIECQDKDKRISQLKEELQWSEMKGAGGHKHVHVHGGKCIHECRNR